MNDVKVELRSGNVAFVRRLYPSAKEGPVGPLVLAGWWFKRGNYGFDVPPHERAGFEMWTRQGNWREDGHEHPMDIVSTSINFL